MSICYSNRLFFILVLWVICVSIRCVDKSNFKTCDQSGFCKRNRDMQPHQCPYYLEAGSFKAHPSKLEGILINSQSKIAFKLELIALVGDIFRLRITELDPIRPRFEATDALVSDPEAAKLRIESSDDEKMVVSMGKHKAVLFYNPFLVDIYSGDQHVVRANARGLMKFEHYRSKESDAQADQNEVEAKQFLNEPHKDTMWEETFKGKTDSKPFGPSSVGMDFSFVGFKHVYGIPEHADNFALRQTRGVSDPYRLYNLDVFEYELNSPMALYGSVPFMLAHSETNTVGLLWLNPSETWVDVEAPSNEGVVSSIVDFVKGSTKVPQRDTHWFSESGIIDIFFLVGPHPKDVMFQYSKLTGTTPLPPLFSIAYHQCRWNYRDEADVRNVDAGFDDHDIPYDVLWLDLDHADDKKYFTWDPYKFPHPEDMLNNLTLKGRKMVTLVDPHIKRDGGYFIHKEASDKGYYVKNKEDQDYEGWCWPGSSSYLDYLNPEVREWWAGRFAIDQYKGSTLSLYTWNDMNEPSVFSEPEITMPKDLKHYAGWEHRDIHNMYGMLMVMSTYKGHVMRSEGKQRPFILSRSHFVGSQRYGAVWTGDNIADWNHYQMSIPMVLSLSISGISFSGADVGGFFRNPSPELMLRWYQAAAYQPFFRAHSHHDTRRREPWLFDDNVKMLIRDAIRARYALLPLWYTLFYENEQNGVPPMRPIWMEFPSETSTFDMQNEYMLGDCLLVRPVLDAGATNVDVYFPGTNEIWYDVNTHQIYNGAQTTQIPVTLDKVPVYQRGGTIIPKKMRIRRSSSLTYNDPYTIVVALNKNRQFANGSLFIDDFNSFQYREGNYLLLTFTYSKNTLQAAIVGGPGKFTTNAWLERVIIVGLPTQPASIVLSTKGSEPTEMMFIYDANIHVLTVRKPAVNMGDEWKMQFKY